MGSGTLELFYLTEKGTMSSWVRIPDGAGASSEFREDISSSWRGSVQSCRIKRQPTGFLSAGSRGSPLDSSACTGACIGHSAVEASFDFGNIVFDLFFSFPTSFANRKYPCLFFRKPSQLWTLINTHCLRPIFLFPNFLCESQVPLPFLSQTKPALNTN